MGELTRRRLLVSGSAAALATAVLPALGGRFVAHAAPAIHLRVATRTIEVNGRAVTVFGLTQANGVHGVEMTVGQQFQVRIENGINEKTLIHWHGMTPPWEQDGTPGLSQPPLEPGESFDYDFEIARAGTNWMHSHVGLQDQNLLAAPLIIRDPAETSQDTQEVVVMLHDFTFRDPAEILAALQKGHDGQQSNVHDIEYDAFLANDRTLDDPQIVSVDPGGRVRLRLINGSAATNFWIDLGTLVGQLIAVDGMEIQPLDGSRFEMAVAQRLDIVVELPSTRSAWPIVAVREGSLARTGIVLATARSRIGKLASELDLPVPQIGLALERRLQALHPMARRDPDRRERIEMTEGPNYTWFLNGIGHGKDLGLGLLHGDRVELTFSNLTRMAHPMHLHGHHFQVAGIDDSKFAGALRDTVLVPAGSDVTVVFDADNPGPWALHCHHLYHMVGGMMTTLDYATDIDRYQ